jgi:MinD-like ATPase involved in chromosome partitioning or flagellar assembly
VFEDTAVQRAVIKQDPFVRSAPNSKATQSIRHLMTRLADVEHGESGGFGKFLKSVFRGKF